MVVSCCVRGCKNRGSGTVDKKIKYFRFPKDAVRRSLWVKAISREDFVPINHRICNAHFTSDDYQNIPNITKLKNNAIPSVFSNCSVKQIVKKELISFDPVLKPVIPFGNNHIVSWDHTYVQKIPEVTKSEETCSDNISIDPSLYMIQTLSVDENIINESNLSKSNEIEPCITDGIKQFGRQSFQNIQKDWREISLMQSFTIKDLRKKIKILQQKVRRYALKIEMLKVVDSNKFESQPKKGKKGMVVET